MTEEDDGGCWRCGAGQHMGDRHDRIIEMMRLKSISSLSPSLLCLFIDNILFLFFIFFLGDLKRRHVFFFFIAPSHRYFFSRLSLSLSARHLRPATRADPQILSFPAVIHIVVCIFNMKRRLATRSPSMTSLNTSRSRHSFHTTNFPPIFRQRKS